MSNDPFQKIVLPRVENAEPPFLDENEILQLLAVAEKPEVDLFAILAYTGMRLGEGLGLTWTYVKFKENVIRVELAYSHGKMGPPKTEASRRSIPMLPLLSERLQALYVEQGEPKPEALLFSLDLEKRTTPLDPSNVRRDFNKALEKAGLKKVDMKSFRHSFVSIMLDSGATLAVISRCVGHANIATTARVYSHLIKEDLGDAGIRADQRFRNGTRTGDVVPFKKRSSSQ
jgi:integrase